MKELQSQGLNVVAISYDSRDILAAFAKQRGITFPLLSDAGSATIKAYGILNPAVEWGLGADKSDPAVVDQIRKFVNAAGTASENQRGMALPGTFIVNRQGRVTSRFFEEFYAERSTTETIVLRTGAAGASVPGTKISTGQLELTTHASDAVVAPGNRFSLILDVTPHKGMHVYAPGASGYKPIALTIAPQPFVQVPPMRYPASEIYFFRPLNERVPVFQKPFRLVQEVVLDATRDAMAALQGKDSLTLTGTIDFQACDDKVCYNPTTVPVTWTVALKPLIRERPLPAR